MQGSSSASRKAESVSPASGAWRSLGCSFWSCSRGSGPGVGCSCSAAGATRAGEFGLAADIGEPLDPVPICVLDKMQLVVEEVIMLKRHCTLSMEDQPSRPMDMLNPAP